jgi:ABC-type lipoprotein export system ATPase subunit
VAILGPSGSGKSTLLNLMSGLDRPSEGEVRFEGRAISSAAEWAVIRARRIGYVFQAFHLLPTMTASENVEVPMMGVVRGSRDREARAAKLLDMVGLSERVGHLPNQLSGGERQRVAIARCLANGPGLILADEPTGNLDSRSARSVMDLLVSVHGSLGATLVVVTHSTEVAAACDRVVTIRDGSVLFDGPNPDYRCTS